MHKLKLIFYYLFIQKLPHSRLWGGFNSIRRSYVSKMLKVMPNDSNSKFENGVYISDARKLGSVVLNAPQENIITGEQSSLLLSYQMILAKYLFANSPSASNCKL